MFFSTFLCLRCWRDLLFIYGLLKNIRESWIIVKDLKKIVRMTIFVIKVERED
jgi:hypothetical protein